MPNTDKENYYIVTDKQANALISLAAAASEFDSSSCIELAALRAALRRVREAQAAVFDNVQKVASALTVGDLDDAYANLRRGTTHPSMPRQDGPLAEFVRANATYHFLPYPVQRHIVQKLNAPLAPRTKNSLEYRIGYAIGDYLVKIRTHQTVVSNPCTSSPWGEHDQFHTCWLTAEHTGSHVCGCGNSHARQV